MKNQAEIIIFTKILSKALQRTIEKLPFVMHIVLTVTGVVPQFSHEVFFIRSPPLLFNHGTTCLSIAPLHCTTIDFKLLFYTSEY